MVVHHLPPIFSPGFFAKVPQSLLSVEAVAFHPYASCHFVEHCSLGDLNVHSLHRLHNSHHTPSFKDIFIWWHWLAWSCRVSRRQKQNVLAHFCASARRPSAPLLYGASSPTQTDAVTKHLMSSRVYRASLCRLLGSFSPFLHQPLPSPIQMTSVKLQQGWTCTFVFRSRVFSAEGPCLEFPPP